MAAAAFFGYALLGLGPGAAFCGLVLAPKSFVVLLALFSAFFWLLVLLVTAALLRGFEPLPPGSVPAQAGALLVAVTVEEAARLLAAVLHRRTAAVLRRMSTASGHSFGRADELLLGAAWGAGQAAVHGLFLFGSLLPLTAGHGTLYAAACPQLSVFLVAALNSLGMGASLVALSVIALDAWSRGALAGAAYAPLAHAAAALLTLGSMQHGGCVPAVAAQLALGLLNTWLAASLAWRQACSRGGSPGGDVGLRPLAPGPIPAGGRPGALAAAAWTDDAAAAAECRLPGEASASAAGGALPAPRSGLRSRAQAG